MTPDPDPARNTPRTRPVRQKLDPRLSFLLSLPEDELRALQERESRDLRKIEDEIQRLVEGSRRSPQSQDPADFQRRLRVLQRELFAPVTTGVHFPGDPKDDHWSSLVRVPFLSVMILSDASAEDLGKLGVEVRCQSGDVFTAFVPIKLLTDPEESFEKSPAIRYIELAHALFPSLSWSRTFTEVDTLHAAGNKGAGVIVGVVDNRLDIHHVDFWDKAAGASRVLFLWDQDPPASVPVSGPDPAAIPDFSYHLGAAYGVEYDKGDITDEVNTTKANPANAFSKVDHNASAGTGEIGHGTAVTGCAAGNGEGSGGTYAGVAPAADIIFVGYKPVPGAVTVAESNTVLDACLYILARAKQLGQPCVINLSQNGDNEGPHDGSSPGERFLDNLFLDFTSPGCAITVSAGNLNQDGFHASGTVVSGTKHSFDLRYVSNIGTSPHHDDRFSIWYDGHDRFTVTVSVPVPGGGTVDVGPVDSGTSTVVPVEVHPGVFVEIHSIIDDPENGDNRIQVLVHLVGTNSIALADPELWTISLEEEAGTTIVNGKFEAWLARTNQISRHWVTPEAHRLTIAPPATCLRVISVGAHTKTDPPVIAAYSGCGPTRDGRIKPEIACVGGVHGAAIIAPTAGYPSTATGTTSSYSTGADSWQGTSISAPIVAGACALLFKCRGSASTWADLKQILLDNAGTTGIGAVPNNAFGFGYLKMKNACTGVTKTVDVMVHDHALDTGIEPYTGPLDWASPDIELRDEAGTSVVGHPTYDPTKRYSNQVWVTVHNIGSGTARNTQVYLYWANPSTHLAFPEDWNGRGFYTGDPGFVVEGNVLVVPTLAASAFTTVHFAWSPPAPGMGVGPDGHCCLLVRLENEADPSQIGAGGSVVIRERNNITIRNVFVVAAAASMSGGGAPLPDPGGRGAPGPGGGGGDEEASAKFYVTGSADDDGLLVAPDLVDGEVLLDLPVQALPWRDVKVIKKHGGRLPHYGAGREHPPHPLARATMRALKGAKVKLRTGIRGAELFELRSGIVTVHAKKGQRIEIPELRVVRGARMPVRVRVRRPKIDGERNQVRVTQLSGGRPVGGVTIRIAPSRL